MSPWLSTALLTCGVKVHSVGKEPLETTSVAHKGLEISSCSHLQSRKTSEYRGSRIESIEE